MTVARKTQPIHRQWLVCGLAIIFLMSTGRAHAAPYATTLLIYSDSLAPTWENWSWDSTIDLAATNRVHSGNAAIETTHNAGFAALSLRTSAPIASNGYTSLAFWIYGNGAPLAVSTQSSDDGEPGAAYEFTPTNGEWVEVVILLTQLGSPAQIARINWQSQSEHAQSTYFLDDIRLLGTQEPPPPATDITLQVDGAAAETDQSLHLRHE